MYKVQSGDIYIYIYIYIYIDKTEKKLGYHFPTSVS